MVSAVYKARLLDWWALLGNHQVGPQLLFLGDLQRSVSTGWEETEAREASQEGTAIVQVRNPDGLERVAGGRKGGGEIDAMKENI